MRTGSLARIAQARPWVAWLAAAAITVASIFVAHNLVTEGPFAWHFGRSTTIQGAIEVLLLWCALYLLASSSRLRRWSPLLLLVGVAGYLRRHHVDGPVLVALAYFEFLLALGALLLARTRAVAGEPVWLGWMVTGLIAWSLALWGLQLAGLGSPRTARILFVLAAVPVFVAARRTPLSLVLLRGVAGLSAPGRAAATAALAFLCALFARTNQYAGHDALWYGFRPEQVLVGGGSAFHAVDLVSPVYYFPKLFEVLLLPLSAMGDFSFVGSFSILVGGTLVLLVLHMLRVYGVPEWLRVLVALGLLTAPALANTALSPKPDTLAALAVVAMLWHLSSMDSAAATGRHFGMLVAWAAVAALAKLNLLPYVAVLGAAGLACMAMRGRESWRHLRWQLPLLLAATAVGILVTARTWLLAGVPTVAPEQLVRLWEFAGLRLRPPVGTLEWVDVQDLADIPLLALDWLFRPARLPHVVITWCGNAWLPLLLAGWATAMYPLRSPARISTWPLWLAAATGAFLLFAVRYHYRGSDGNYFIAPLAAVWMLASALLARSPVFGAARRPVVGALAIAILFQAYYAFSSAGWGMPGTRTLDLDFVRSVWDTPSMRAAKLREAGLSGIAEWLGNTTDKRWHVVGTAPEPDGFWLPARYESLQTISWSYPDLLGSPTVLATFLRCARVHAVLLEAHVDVEKGLSVWAHIASRGVTDGILVRSGNWQLVAVSPSAAPPDCSAMVRH